MRRELTDAYVRLVGMKSFSDRAVDCFRSAGPDDRRYPLFSPTTKMKVSTEGEKVLGPGTRTLTHERAGSHVIGEQAAYPCWFGAGFEAADETKPQALVLNG